MWAAIWSVLVVGTVVGGFFLVRSVYRSGQRFAAEFAICSDRLSAATEQLGAELAEYQGGHDILGDYAALAKRVETLRQQRSARVALRAERRALTASGWGLSNWLEQRQEQKRE